MEAGDHYLMASVEVGEQGARPRMMAQVGLVVKEPEEVAEEVLMVRCFGLALEVGPVLKMVQARWGFSVEEAEERRCWVVQGGC